MGYGTALITTYPPAQALGVGGLDAFTHGVLRGPVYDPSEHGALLPDPARSRAYLVTNVDPATGAARDGALWGRCEGLGGQPRVAL